MYYISKILLFVTVFSYGLYSHAEATVRDQIQEIQNHLTSKSLGGIERVIYLISDDNEDYNLRAYAAYALQNHFQLRDEIFEWAKPKTLLVLDDFVLFFKEREEADFIRWIESIDEGEKTKITPMIIYHEQTHSHHLVINSNHISEGCGSILDLKLANILEFFENHPVVEDLIKEDINLHETISIKRKGNGNFFVIYGFNDKNMDRRMLALIYPNVIVEDSPLSERMRRLQFSDNEKD
jgi:hypothetical protein